LGGFWPWTSSAALARVALGAEGLAVVCVGHDCCVASEAASLGRTWLALVGLVEATAQELELRAGGDLGLALGYALLVAVPGALREVAVGLQGLATGLGLGASGRDGAIGAHAGVGLLAIGQAAAVAVAADRHRAKVWRGRKLRPRFFQSGEECPCSAC
jgi:hypothetical protein